MSEKIVLTVMQKRQPLQFSASRAVSSSSKSQSGDTLYWVYRVHCTLSIYRNPVSTHHHNCLSTASNNGWNFIQPNLTVSKLLLNSKQDNVGPYQTISDNIRQYQTILGSPIITLYYKDYLLLRGLWIGQAEVFSPTQAAQLAPSLTWSKDGS